MRPFQMRFQEAWILKISRQPRKVQEEWLRACCQWLCGLFPWEGRCLSDLAVSTLNGLWVNDSGASSWGRLSEQIIAQIPREDTIADFGLPDAIREDAMAVLAYTSSALAGDFETNVRLATTWAVDALFAPAEMGSISYLEQDQFHPDPAFLDEILDKRLSRTDLIVAAGMWRSGLT